MKLYKLPTAAPGERWHSSKTGLKDFEEVELPKGDGRQGMAAFLNGLEQEVSGAPSGSAIVYAEDALRPTLDPLQEAELRAVQAAGRTTMSGVIHYDYQSPFSARTALAAIDGSMCAKAIVQLHGEDLGKVVDACVKRVTELAIAAGAQGGSDGL